MARAKAPKRPRPPRKPVLPLSPTDPKTLAIWLVAAPAAAQFFLLLLIGLEADSSTEVLIALILSSGTVGFLLSGVGYGPLAAAAAAAWLPALFGWRHWYWAMDMHSPGGSAQWIVGSLGWKDAYAPAAIAAVCAASALSGWAALRAARLQRRWGP